MFFSSGNSFKTTTRSTGVSHFHRENGLWIGPGRGWWVQDPGSKPRVARPKHAWWRCSLEVNLDGVDFLLTLDKSSDSSRWMYLLYHAISLFFPIYLRASKHCNTEHVSTLLGGTLWVLATALTAFNPVLSSSRRVSHRSRFADLNHLLVRSLIHRPELLGTRLGSEAFVFAPGRSPWEQGEPGSLDDPGWIGKNGGPKPVFSSFNLHEPHCLRGPRASRSPIGKTRVGLEEATCWLLNSDSRVLG